MSKKNYVIEGITPLVAENWKNNVREDFKIYKSVKTGKLLGAIRLTTFEAIKAMFQIKKYNKTHRHELKLIRQTAKHI